jgi:hypothetical protein
MAWKKGNLTLSMHTFMQFSLWADAALHPGQGLEIKAGLAF